MRSILEAATRAMVVSLATMLGGLLIVTVGADSYEAWYRTYSLSALLGAAIAIGLGTGLCAAIGFRAGTAGLTRSKEAGKLVGLSSVALVSAFLVLTGKEYGGGFLVPLLAFALANVAVAFYLARLDRRAGHNVV